MDFTPLFFSSSLPLLVIAGTFAVVNFIAIKTGKLTSYNGSKRLSYGTVYYPVAFFILTALLWQQSQLILIASMLVLALGDAIAAIVGKAMVRPYNYRIGGEQKSIQGSIAMFFVTAVLIGIVLWRFEPALEKGILMWVVLIAGIVATVAESISYRGSDNLTVPLGTAFSMHLMIYHPELRLSFSVGMLIAFGIAFASLRMRFLTTNGAMATFVLGTVVFGVGGCLYALPILSFFILSSLLSKTGRHWKNRFKDTFEKSSQRDMWQVWANGGLAGLIVLLHYLLPRPWWHYLFLAAVAAATADTWATEIGIFSKSKPRHILNWQAIEPGTSGGVSLLGSTGAVAGSFVIALHLGMAGFHWNLIGLITAAGFIGSMIDSILGATIQAQYQCPACKKITEKRRHCQDVNTVLIAGHRRINNDVVNMFCTLGSVFVMGVFLLM